MAAISGPELVRTSSHISPQLNYDEVVPGLYVGACLRNTQDVHHLRAALGVDTIVSMQDDADIEANDIPLARIEAEAQFAGMRYLRAPVSDAMAEEDVIVRLPAAVAKVAKEATGTIYVHCNGGRGRAPTLAAAYLYWAKGYSLQEALDAMTSGRQCKPKADAVRRATAAAVYGSDAGGSHAEAAAALVAEDATMSAEERAKLAAALLQ